MQGDAWLEEEAAGTHLGISGSYAYRRIDSSARHPMVLPACKCSARKDLYAHMHAEHPDQKSKHLRRFLRLCECACSHTDLRSPLDPGRFDFCGLQHGGCCKKDAPLPIPMSSVISIKSIVKEVLTGMMQRSTSRNLIMVQYKHAQHT